MTARRARGAHGAARAGGAGDAGRRGLGVAPAVRGGPRPRSARRASRPAAVAAATPPQPTEMRSARSTSCRRPAQVEAQHDGTLGRRSSRATRSPRSDVVRTSPASGAVLRLANGRPRSSCARGVEIQLSAGARSTLPRAGRRGGDPAGATSVRGGAGANVDLRRGKVLARVSTAGALAITSSRRGRRRAGRRASSSSPTRRVASRSRRIEGTARFAAAGKSVALPAGTVSREPGRARRRGDPEHIPEDVFLQRRLADRSTATANAPRSRGARRRRRSSPCARRRGWRPPRSAPTASSRSPCPCGSGKTPVEVEAEDLTGRTRQAGDTLTRRAAAAARADSPRRPTCGNVQAKASDRRARRPTSCNACAICWRSRAGWPSSGASPRSRSTSCGSRCSRSRGWGSCCWRRIASSWTRCWTSRATSSNSPSG